jgi:hypothetical protein
MMYAMVLITNLGVITPLAFFDDQVKCISQQAMVPKTMQASAICLPVDDVNKFQMKITDNNNLTLDALRKFVQKDSQ